MGSSIVFLKAISKPSENLSKSHQGSTLWVCSKRDAEGNWYGEPYDIASHNIENSELNNYFCISRLKPVDGVLARKNANFLCLMCIVLDDIGTKITKAPDLEPSWKTETSPNNEQWGYILANPITDSAEAENLIKLVYTAPH